MSLRPGVGLNVASDMKVPSVDTVSPLRPGIGLNIASDSKVPLCRHRLPFKAWCRSEYFHAYFASCQDFLFFFSSCFIHRLFSFFLSSSVCFVLFFVLSFLKSSPVLATFVPSKAVFLFGPWRKKRSHWSSSQAIEVGSRVEFCGI